MVCGINHEIVHALVQFMYMTSSSECLQARYIQVASRAYRDDVSFGNLRNVSSYLSLHLSKHCRPTMTPYNAYLAFLDVFLAHSLDGKYLEGKPM